MAFGYASRREVDVLRQQLSMMDSAGTRGMGSIQIQMGEVIKDVAELKAEVKAHELSHSREAAQRRKEQREHRRYAITTAIAALATLAAVLGLFLTGLH